MLSQSEILSRLSASLPGAAFVYVLRPDGSDYCEFQNAGCNDIWGEDVGPKVHDTAPLWATVYPQDVDALRQSIAVSARSLEAWDARFRIYDHRGALRHMLGRGSPSRASDGSVIWLTLMFDVSAEIESTQAMQRAAQHLTAVVETLPDGFALFDAEERVVSCNRKFRLFHGYPEGRDLTGMLFSDLLVQAAGAGLYPEADADEAAWRRAQYRHFQEAGAPREQRLGADGWMRFLDRATEDGGRIAIRIETTETRRVEAKLRQLSEAKAQFAANMSHELRTPLNAILGTIDIIQEEPLSPAQEEHVHTIQTAGEAMLDLINDVLDFSALEAERLKLNLEATAVAPLIDEVVTLLKPLALKKQLALVVEVDQMAPERLMLDGRRMRQVLINLAGNAIKFTEKGRVTIYYRMGPDGAVVGVGDTGIGIAECDLPKIFRDFEQADNTDTRAFGGTGLGLAISKRLVELMGGRIAVTSDLGVGSDFGAVYPVPAQTGALPDAAPEPPAVRAALPDLSGKRVLVVDDTALNQRILKAMLRETQAELSFASDGHEAVAQWQATRPDLVLMDISMPRMSGIEATGRIRRLEAEAGAEPCAILIVSAARKERLEAEDVGLNLAGFLEKPVRKATLATHLSQILGGG